MIRRWFASPLFEGDEEKTRRAELINGAITVNLLLTVLIIIGVVLGNNVPIGALVIAILWFAVLLSIRRILHSGRVTFVAFTLATLFFVFLTAANISLGTIRTPTASIYVFWVILVGMLFQLPGIVLATIASSLAVMGLILAENAGLLPKPNYSVGITQWMNFTALFGMTASAVYYSNRLVFRALARADDEIARREKVEIELRKLTRMVEQSPASIVLTDLAGNIEYVNPSFSKVTGYPFDAVVGKNPRILKSDKTKFSTYQELWAALTAGQEWQGELVNRKKDGSLYHEWAVIAPMTDEHGIVSHYLAVKEDITTRKQAESALRSSEHRLRLLADNTRDVIWTMAPDGSVTYVSPAVMAVRGFTPMEAMKQTIEETLTPDSQAISIGYFTQLHTDLAAGAPPQHFRGDLEYRCKDGSTVWTEVMAYPIVNEDGMFEVLGVTRDISEHKRRRGELETEGRRLTDQLVQLDRQRSLGQMSASLGHELNQPLTAILTNAQVMQRGLRSGRLETAQVGELIERIIHNTRRASDIIERIRTFIRPSEAKHVALDLQQVVLEALHLMEADIHQHQVQIRFATIDSPVLVLGDVIQLSQVLLNALRNAIEALQQVQQRVIEIQINTTQEQVTLSITDTGPGLTPENLEQVGTAFFSTKSTGLGLGLSISRNIMAKHQGTLSVANASCTGACVTLTLPVNANRLPE